MAYITTGSSNSVSGNKPLDIEIIISPDPSRGIALKGMFKVENFSKVADNLATLECVVLGQSDDTKTQTTIPVQICKLLAPNNTPGTRQYNLGNYKGVYPNLIVRISGGNCIIEEKENLKITFYDAESGDKEKKNIDFLIHKLSVPPVITSLEASETILQGADKSVDISWTTNGENYSYTLRDQNLKIIKDSEGQEIAGNSTGLVKGKKTIDNVEIENNSYTLEVTQGEVTKTRKVRVLVLPKLDICQPPTSGIIGNMCISQDSDYIYSIILKKKKGHKFSQVDHIGYSNEGFSGKWLKMELSTREKDQLKPFATSPMIHLKGPGEADGRLLFIGGSYVKPMETSNSVAIIDRDWDADAGVGSRLTIFEDLPWSSRMGHCCAIFPHGGEDKIWLLGGVDEWGAAQNDVWVSGDGESWNNIGKTGIVNTEDKSPKAMDWDARCMAGISVELSVKLEDKGAKKALWFGGGFSEIGGKETSDIWKFEGGQWQKITPLTINSHNNNSYRSSGLAYIGKDAVDATGMYLLGGFEKELNRGDYFCKVNLDNLKYSTSDIKPSLRDLDTNKEAYILTAYFKGCLWYLVFTNEGYLGITYSSLYYWVPRVTQETLILS